MRPAPSNGRAPRYQPPARSDGSSGGGVFRDGPRSGVNTITRPAPSTATRGDAARAPGRTTSIDSRYGAGTSSSRTSAPRAADTARSSPPGNSRSATSQARGATPSASGRYSGTRDAVPGATRGTGPAAKPDAARDGAKPNAGRGTAKPEANRGAGTTGRAPNTTATNGKPVTRAPRLSDPGIGRPTNGTGTGTIANGSTGPAGGVAGGSTGSPISTGVVGPATCGGAFPDNSWCASSFGCHFFDPWCGSSFGHCGWGFGWGFGCGWGFSLWWPCWSWSWSWWDCCYHDCWWSCATHPGYVSTAHWWYPSSTYCPAYLYVPSTVVVIDDASYAGSEVIVAAPGETGTGVTERRPDAEVAGMTASLATKYVELGDVYFRAGRFTDAVGAYGKARSYAPDDASLHFVLADAVFAEGDYLYAAFLIGEGLRLDPGMAAVSTDKRTFYGDAAVFDAQMAALDRHLARRPDDVLAHLVRGYNLRFSGRPVEAITAFRRTLELDPGNRPARTFLDVLEKPAAPESVIVR